MVRHLCLRIGDWKIENWHLYRWRKHRAVKNADVVWHMWDKIL